MRELDEIPDRKGAVDTPITRCVRAARQWALANRASRLKVAAVLLFLLAAWYLMAIVTGSDGVREAVFRCQLPRWQPYTDVVFLSVEGGRDPSDRLLGRFKGQTPTVMKVSESRWTAEGLPVVANGSSKSRRGIVLSTEDITWVLPFLVVVDGRYYGAPRAASGDTYVVVRSWNGWVVITHRLNWIS